MANQQIVSGSAMVTLPARVYVSQAEKVERVLKQTGESQADFIRRAIANQVALDLGEEPESLPPVVRGRAGSPTSQLAKRLGMDPKQLMEEITRAFAAQTLGIPVKLDERIEDLLTKPGAAVRPQQPEPKQTGKSGTMRAVNATLVHHQRRAV